MAKKTERKTVAEYPELVAQWHPTKNGELGPGEVTDGSEKKVWWKCGEGPDHEWQGRVSHRCFAGSGCRACNGRQVSVTNSLANLFPDVAVEWHPTRNGDLTPADVVASNTKRKHWWKCPAGPDHEWEAAAGRRTTAGTGCPFCRGQRASSTNNLQALFPEVAAEWHSIKNGKTLPCDVVAGSNKKYWWKCSEGPDHEWQASVCGRTGEKKSGCPFCRGLKVSVTNRLSTRFPDLVGEWHPSMNGDLTPDQVVAGSDKKVWWQCPNGPDHEWAAKVDHRTRLGSGCPFCRGLKVSVTNSLQTLFPEIASQWHPVKNGALTPSLITSGSRKKVWWKCTNGPDHEWKGTVANRTGLDRGCPACVGRQVSVTNSLAALFPDVAAEWHPTKNGRLTPDEISAGNDEKVWWKCPAGPDHEWRAAVGSRTGNETGCPFCVGLQVSVTNSLSARFPQIALQWHPTKNGSLSPDAITAGNPEKVWWKCPAGPDHEWRATVGHRTRGGGCPACTGLQVSVTNSLASLVPEVAAEWHPTRNGGLSPDKITSRNPKKVWWRCQISDEHDWQATVSNRTRVGSGCPYCSIVPRSRQEIRLAFELAHHLPIDHEFHKIKTAKRLWDVDICAPELKLVIEFDGAYFHAERAEKDRTKAQNLRRNGWRVIRVREAPLRKLSKWNVVIPTNADAHEAALLVLEHLQAVLDMDIPRMDERRAASGPLRAAEAEAYIEKLLREKEAAREE